ncbi:PREDICTED: nucleoporin NDC1 [Polistes dominula]|uniref:Nucleoporin NDC1 n=1 Tax=Polistes dominula TaxID=743375 RepID=A0ABM1IXM2_POLDO|nr:PREDICTED: nucleoporin NDC1 [Polistes dominula]
MFEANRKDYSGLLKKRMLIALICNVVLQFILLCSLIFIINVNLNVTLWMQNTWDSILSLKLRIYFLIFVGLLQGILHCNYYLHRQPYIKNRFLKLQHIFTSQYLLRGILSVLMGCNVAWLHLSLKKGNHNLLIDNCNILYGSCLIEEHYFLIIGGLWTGFYVFLTTAWSNQRCFHFNIIPLTKFSKFKTGICQILSTLPYISFCPVIYFMIGYFLMGSYMRDFILSITSAQIDVKPLDSLSRLLSISLIFYLWVYQSVLIFVSKTTTLLLEIFLTEWIPLEIQQANVFNNNISTITLADVLSSDDIPMLQHLAYLDLVTLAVKQKTRRKILFTLSQPGGHPYNWNCIIQKVLHFISGFTNELNEITNKPKEQHFSSKMITSLNASNLSAFKSVSDYTFNNMRKLIVETKPPMINIDDSKPPEVKWLTYKYFLNKKDKIISYLLSKPLIYYVFGEQEDLKIEYALFNSQAVIWAIEAVSSLANISLEEDSYGIVQKDLSTIFNTLLALKFSVDKLHKSNMLNKKSHNSDKSSVKLIFNSLRSASKRSLYRITIGFQSYINDLSLDPMVIEQLQCFLNYKE